jgi:hypothetical protein
MDVDVISQGREPGREYRLPSSRRWRGAGTILAVVVAGLAVTGLGMGHGTGLADNATPAASTAPQPFVPLVPGYMLPLPQAHPAAVVCSPSSGACSIRFALLVHSVIRH